MEENLSLPELDAIIKAQREKEHRHNVFMAAMKGINLDEGKAQSKFEEVKKRAEEKIKSSKQAAGSEKDELKALGFEVEEWE